MKRIVILLIVALLGQWMYAKDYQVSGPQGGLAMTLTLPDGFDTATDSCPLVILMHGIFSSKNFTPMPRIAKQLAKADADLPTSAAKLTSNRNYQMLCHSKPP